MRFCNMKCLGWELPRHSQRSEVTFDERYMGVVPFAVTFICGKNRPICGQHEQVRKNIKGGFICGKGFG